ncbi:MAG: ATP phosphoribosyltransferase [Christensenellales bacterium]|jgi:ATP phosphoribosyltransferase|nr:ATP phosphoribosyltransferase [Clostridiales bacterium]
MLKLALPKGRLAKQVLDMLKATNEYKIKVEKDDRRLVFEDEKSDIAYFFVKPSDVAIYVERGVADVGVVGKDILLEQKPNVYELLDLNIGVCKMCVAAKNGYEEDKDRVLKVASKFVNVTNDYYNSINREIEVIKLNGSIELAPLLGISDVIVDIVETGTTLRENDMSVIKDIFNISARLIANKVSYKFKEEQINKLKKDLEKSVGR